MGARPDSRPRTTTDAGGGRTAVPGVTTDPLDQSRRLVETYGTEGLARIVAIGGPIRPELTRSAVSSSGTPPKRPDSSLLPLTGTAATSRSPTPATRSP